MSTSPFFHIRSDKFTILPGEDEDIVNEGMYGKSLCLYLQRKLSERGWTIDFLGSEDWGWAVGIRVESLRFLLCVYGVEMEAGGLDLCVTVQALPDRKWSWKRLRFIDTTEVVGRMNSELKAIFIEDNDVQFLGSTQEFPL
ncbi:MAG: hypothetical protein K8U03_08325 [Planctomycetia bacterium]|nr:hypothetical protein [Planctomycetia bacterium]